MTVHIISIFLQCDGSAASQGSQVNNSTSQQSNGSVSRENINSKQVKYHMSAAAENEPFSKVEVCNASIQQSIQDNGRHII